MTKSLADLRAERSTSRPARTYRATVGDGQKYVAEVQALTMENDDILTQEAAVDRPLKMGESPELPSRVVEIRERLAELAALMAEYEGDLTVAPMLSDGEWARWKIEHPAREEGQPGHREDAMVQYVCNADDLIEALATFVTHWEGEPLAPGDFDALNLMRPDKKAIAELVVQMYEVGAYLPKLRSGLQALLAIEPSQSSPAPSAPPSDASTAGSPASDTTTTTPAES